MVENDRLLLIPRQWSIAGIPMPNVLLPTGLSYETVRSGQLSFDVEIAMPLLGRIVAYTGTLTPDPSPAA